MKTKFDYQRHLFLRVSTDEKSEFPTIDIIPLSFPYKVNLTVEDGRQLIEACHGVGIWQKPTLKSVPDILHHFVKLFRDTGFLVPFNAFARLKLNEFIILLYQRWNVSKQ